MSNTTLQDLLNLSIDDLTAIIDGATDAKKLYVFEKIIAPLKFTAQGGFPIGYKFLGDDLGDPFYNDIQTLLNSTPPGPAVGFSIDLVVRYYRYLSTLTSRTITQGRNNTLISSPFIDEFILVVSIEPITTPISNMIFENMTIIFTNNSKVDSCKFFRCKLKADAGNVVFSTCELIDCLIEDMNLSLFYASSLIDNCKIKSNLDFSDDTCKMYRTAYKSLPTGETNNLTLDVNYHIPNL